MKKRLPLPMWPALCSGLLLAVFGGAILPGPFTRFHHELAHQLHSLSRQVPADRAYLMTDKTLYAPGETIWLSAFTRLGGMALPAGQTLTVELLDPKGSVSSTIRLRLDKHGQARGDFALTDDMPGGRYKLRALPRNLAYSRRDSTAAVFEKVVTVQAVTLPRVKLTLDFERKAYGPADEVGATLKAFGNDNKPLAGRVVHWEARVANKPAGEGNVTVSPAGTTAVRFSLPAHIEAADGLLTLTLDHEGLTEAVARAIPIVLNRVKLDLLPEGGELVAGLPGRVAVRATNEFGEPADVAGYVADERGTRVTSFRSLHDGLGRFDMTPRPGHEYFVHLQKPAGTPDSVVALPEPLPGGFTILVERQRPGEDFVKVLLTGSVSDRVLLTGVQRERIVRSITTEVGPAPAWVRVPVGDLPAGVLQLTLFDSKKIARAERLVMVNTHRQLRLTVKTDRKSYGLRQKVKLTIQATDERGLPTPAAVALSVVDDQNLAFADDKQSTILSWLLAESDLKRAVRDPRYYFDPKEKQAGAALDLVLLTHGWRRFTWERIRAQPVPSPEELDREIAAAEEERVRQQQAATRTAVGGRRGRRQTEVVRYTRPVTRRYAARVQGTGKLSGRVEDRNTLERIPGVDVVAKLNGAIKGHATTDQKGYYSISPLGPGAYTIEFINIAYNMVRTTGVTVQADRTTFVNASLPELSQQLGEVQVVAYRIPIIDKDNTTTGGTLTNEQIMKMPTREVGTLARTIAGVFSRNDRAEENVKGSRAGGTVFYINGVKQAAAAPGAEAPAAPRPVEVVRLDEAAAPVQVLANRPAAAVRRPANDYGYYQAREFAAPVYNRATAAVSPRTDFRSTLYWKPGIELDHNGRAVVEFYTGDATTSYRAVVEGLDADGTAGRAEAGLYTEAAVTVSLKLPPHVVTGDTVALPLVVANRTDKAVAGPLDLRAPAGWQFVGTPLPATLTLAPHATRALYGRYVVGGPEGLAELGVTFGDGGDGQPLDQLAQQLPVLPRGYPVTIAGSGSAAARTYAIDTRGALPGTVRMTLTAFPSVENDLLKGVEGILREPSGCFEQTSTSSYPNVFVLDYLRQQRDPDPKLVANAEALLDRGYAKLTSYETAEKGYEWFGSAPAHEALTAYGLLQFADMRRVRPSAVSDQMVDRTHRWLMDRRDGRGGFRKSARALDSFGRAHDDINNAYIVYALAEAGYRDIGPELAAATEKAAASDDPYQLALMASALLASQDAGRARPLLSALYRRQDADGGWTGARHSVTRSEGQSLRVETTALALLAAMRDERRPGAALRKGVQFLIGMRQGAGNFSSTQGTILALKALTAYSKFARQTAEDGSIGVWVGDKEIGRVAYAAGQREEVVLAGLEQYLGAPGQYQVEVRYANGVKSPLPYTLAVDWRTAQAPSSPRCAVRLTTALNAPTARVGESIRFNAVLTNQDAAQGQPMTMALLGLPAGLTPQPWQLKQLQERGVIDFYELRDGRLACYFRDLRPGERVEINLDLKAEVPGTFSAPSSVAYLYYTDEYKHWVPGVVGMVRP